MRRTVPTSRPLSEAMSYLLSSTTPKDWRAAVVRSAQMLADSWNTFDSRGKSMLGTLSLTLYTLARERGVAVADIDCASVCAALDDQPEYKGEPIELRNRITASLEPEQPEIWRVYRELTYQCELLVDTGAVSSGLRHAAHQLLPALMPFDNDEMAFPDAPTPIGSLQLTVTSSVLIIVWQVGWGSASTLSCNQCNAFKGGVLLVDGPNASYICVSGHTMASPELTAERVRYALTQMSDETGAPSPTTLQGEATLHGDFKVARSDMPEDTNPRSGFFK